MIFFFFTNRYKYNVEQVCYINYVHLVSLEAGTSPEEDHQLSALWVLCLPSPQRLILCFNPILEGDSWEESQTLLQILLGLFCP